MAHTPAQKTTTARMLPSPSWITWRSRCTRFSEDDSVGSSIFSLVPVNLPKLKSSLQDIASQLKFWEEDLPTPTVMLAELKEWVAHWEKRHTQSHPVSLFRCLQHADEDQFPNVKQLLCIGCTLPVGSADAEWSFSAFRRIKTYLRSRMSRYRLSGLALMHVHHSLHVEGDMPEVHPGQQEEDVPVQHHQTESWLKGLPNQRTVLYWWIYL